MTAHSTAAAVIFEEVTKVYGETVVAVDRVSFEIAAGTLVTLLGPSGCGKTTTLRMIAGLEMSNAGRILIGDRDVTRLPATDRDVSMVFQSYALFPHMTVGENVAYGLNVSGVDKAEARDRARDGLNLVGLDGYAARLPSELSGGQQQRVAVARALVLEPQVLLFDEPLSNLDAKLRRQVREEIRDIQRKLGLTVVYVTHDQEEALAVSDRIIVMNNATVAQDGSPRDLYEAPADLFVADFIGDANLLEVTIASVEGDYATVQVGGLSLWLPHRGLEPGAAHIAIRPDAIRLSPASPPSDAPSPRDLQGRISRASYLGSHMEYTLATEIGDLFVKDSNVASPLPPEEAVTASFSSHGITLVGETGSV